MGLSEKKTNIYSFSCDNYNYINVFFISKQSVDLDNYLVLEEIQIYDGIKLIIYDTGEYIGAQTLNKGIFGWKSVALSAPVRKAKNNEPYRPDVQNMRVGEFNYYFGYVNPDFVKSVMIETEENNLEYKVNSYYWYVISREGPTNKNLKFIMHDGSMVYYPFQ